MKKTTRYLIAAIVVITIAGIAAGVYKFNQRHKDLQKVTPDVVIPAADLLKAYETDEAGATSRFSGKILDVTGTIREIKPGENNAISILLETGNELSSVICTLAENKDSSSLKPGEQVTIRGECSGFLMDVLLNNCTIIRE